MRSNAVKLWGRDGENVRGKVVIASIVLAFVLVAVIGIGFQVWRQDDSLAAIQRQGVIRIGYAVENPYAYLNAAGQVTGLDPELARVIANRLGVTNVEWCLTDFGSLIDGLNAEKFDIVAAGMFITPDRQLHVAFSDPTIEVHSGLLVQPGNPHHLHSYLDITRDATARIAVISGSAEDLALKHLGLPARRLLEVPDARSGRMLVDSAQADGLALSAPTLESMLARQKLSHAQLAQPFLPYGKSAGPCENYVAFAFRKPDRRLRHAWNVQLRQFLGSSDHLRLISRFGLTAADVPGASSRRLSKTALSSL